MNIIAIKDAFDAWEYEVKPLVLNQYGNNDYCALSESWQSYTDSLYRDGQMNDLQRQYCPEWNVDIPEYDGEFIINSMGVLIDFSVIECQNSKSQYENCNITISRGNKTVNILYHANMEYNSNTVAFDIFGRMLSDTAGINSYDDFPEWAECAGLDPDDTEVINFFNMCIAAHDNLKTIFTDSEVVDIREMFCE